MSLSDTTALLHVIVMHHSPAACYCHCHPLQALEILELRDQLQDAQEAITEANTHATGLQRHSQQLEAQVASLQQQLEQALR